MISQTENAISHIETFTEQLSKDLSVLDGVMKSVLITVYYWHLGAAFKLVQEVATDIIY